MAAGSMLKATTPEPIGKPGGPGLFHIKGLMLPPYVQHVARELMKQGHSESESIQRAIGIITDWAHGHMPGSTKPVHPDTVAAAQLALREWQAAKALARAKRGGKPSHLSNGASVRTLDFAGPKGYIHGWIKVGGGSEFKLVKTEEEAGERRPRHRITAYDKNGKEAGRLEWHGTTRRVLGVEVEPEHQRKGLGTAMWQMANEVGPKPKHSNDRTAAGTAFAKKVGGSLPKNLRDMSNGGSVTQLNFADTEPDADDMMAHVRAAVPKGHGMKVPDGTEPAKVAKMHGYLHRQGNAKHSHSNGAMNYSLKFAKQSNAGTVKGVAGTSPGARKKASARGEAMPDGSFPVSNRMLYEKARRALGRTNSAKRAKVKAFLTRVAKKKGWPPPGGDTNMSLAHDGLVRALQLANLPHAQFPRVQTNPKPSQGLGKAMASYRQPVTTTAKAGNEMFPPRARKTTGPASGRNIPYGTPKGTRPPPGGPQAPLRLPKGGYEGMQIYTPANPAEHSHVMKALRGARALRRQGRTAQANSVMAGLVRQVTGRARKMPNGQMRAHTIREVTTGLAQMAKGVHGITTSGSTGVRGHGLSASPFDTLDFAGPKGYVHGWILVGPGGQTFKAKHAGEAIRRLRESEGKPRHTMSTSGKEYGVKKAADLKPGDVVKMTGARVVKVEPHPQGVKLTFHNGNTGVHRPEDRVGVFHEPSAARKAKAQRNR